MPEITPPQAARRPHELTGLGAARVDDWYWLRDRDDPEVIAYLEAETAYANQVLAPTSELQEQLFDGIKRRVQETDAGPPARSGDWWYYTRTEDGLQYPVMCRRPAGAHNAASVATDARAGRPSDEEVVLDENEVAGDSEYLAVGVFDISPDHRVLAYGVDLDGSETYTVRFRRLDAGGDLDDVLAGAYYGSAWSADGTVFFYVRPDEAMRPWQVWCHVMDTAQDQDRLVFQEDDPRFFVDVELSRSRRRVVITTASKTSGEVRWLDAAQPAGRDPEVLLARQPGVECSAEHDGDGWLVVTNRPDQDGRARPNFVLLRVEGDSDDDNTRVVLEHRDDIKLDGVDAFRSYSVVTERSATDGLERLRVIERDGNQHVIQQPEAAYSLLGGQNPEWEQDHYRFGYTSLVTPRSSVDYVVADRRRIPVWGQIVPDYDPSRFRTERLWAQAPDGTRIPVSLVCRADVPTDGTAAGLLYGYGAYEISIDPAFSVPYINLVERGAVFAIAHIRGGGEMGRRWYEEGRMENKANTFGDFIAAAEMLVRDGWVSPARLVARGGSAGGLLMGAVLNLRPDLWRAIVAEVPFVDVVTTMSDVDLPLTVTEWEEWGDPLHDPAAYARMLSYSPYDNVSVESVGAVQSFPSVYASAGLNDPRVGFWEPAKWVAKLRACGAGRADRPVLLRTEMGAGHGGPSGRYDTWRDEARVQAFVLTQTGLA